MAQVSLLLERKPFHQEKKLIDTPEPIEKSKSILIQSNQPSQSTGDLFIKHVLTINYSPAIKCC